MWTGAYWPEPNHTVKQNVVYTFTSCMWIPVYSQQLTMFVWILNVICVVVVGCFAVAGSVCRFISSFYLKAPYFLKHYNFTSILTILRFSFFYFYICICELLQCVFVHCCCWLVAVFALFCTSILLFVSRDSKGQDLPSNFKFNEHTRTSKYYFYNVWSSCLTQLLETKSTGI